MMVRPREPHRPSGQAEADNGTVDQIVDQLVPLDGDSPVPIPLVLLKGDLMRVPATGDELPSGGTIS